MHLSWSEQKAEPRQCSEVWKANKKPRHANFLKLEGEQGVEPCQVISWKVNRKRSRANVLKLEGEQGAEPRRCSEVERRSRSEATPML